MAAHPIQRFVREPAPALWARWVFLRALGAIFFSAFYSLAFQIHALVGSRGISPVRELLDSLRDEAGFVDRVWRVPTLLWIGSSDGALTALVTIGMIASLCLVANVWPRVSVLVCGVCFLSFVAAAQEFSTYQSDGMLMEAAFLSLFFAPRGLRPGLGLSSPPTQLTLFMLRWEWFRIYFLSGVVKLLSGDPQWAHLTAMDHYYENGPLPTWIGWYAQEIPGHAFHAATALWTLVMELGVVWLMFFGVKARRVLFVIATSLQVGIILTANYAFLNYLVLSLGFLLLDDDAFAKLRLPLLEATPRARPTWRVAATVFALSWIFLATLEEATRLPRSSPLAAITRAIEPLRIANAYGLFAVMTTERIEIEFQGTRDGVTWVEYPFRYKPQDVRDPPGIYAPYQPRFEWNLWFASLGTWRENEWVVETEMRLLERDSAVLALFRRDPFEGEAPKAVRAVAWQYWFTTPQEKRDTGAWWRREMKGLYAPMVGRKEDGEVGIVR